MLSLERMGLTIPWRKSDLCIVLNATLHDGVDRELTFVVHGGDCKRIYGLILIGLATDDCVESEDSSGRGFSIGRTGHWGDAIP